MFEGLKRLFGMGASEQIPKEKQPEDSKKKKPANDSGGGSYHHHTWDSDSDGGGGDGGDITSDPHVDFPRGMRLIP